MPENGLAPIRTAALIVATWLVAAAFFSWQYYNQALSRGELGHFAERLLANCAVMLLWAVFTPPLMALADLVPVQKPHRLRNAVLLLFVAGAAALLRSWIDLALGLAAVPFLLSAAGLFHPHFVFAMVVVGVAHFLRLEREENARRREEARSDAQATEARLRQLRADLNPHFLFNTLNAVATLLHGDPDGARRMLRELREFLRSAVSAGDVREVRLAEELQFVARYFGIQAMRFGRKLTTEIRVAEPRLNDAAVPPLLLQPLVENSIIHGIGRRAGGGGVRVIVDEQPSPNGAWLRIEVRDDGPGCEPEKVFANAGVGVGNSLARLESMYGRRQSLTYEQRDGAFVARILIPLRWSA